MEANEQQIDSDIAELIASVEIDDPAPEAIKNLYRRYQEKAASHEPPWHVTKEGFLNFLSDRFLHYVSKNFGEVKFTISSSKKPPTEVKFTGDHNSDHCAILVTDEGNKLIINFPSFIEKIAICDSDYRNFEKTDIVAWDKSAIADLVKKIAKKLRQYFEEVELGPTEDRRKIERPLSEVVGAYRRSTRIKTREVLEYLQTQADILGRTFLAALPKIEEYLAQHRTESDTAGALLYLEKSGVLDVLDKPTYLEAVRIIKGRLENYFEKCEKVQAYRKKYFDAPEGLVEELYGIPQSEGKGKVEAVWKDAYVILIPDDELSNKYKEKLYIYDLNCGHFWRNDSAIMVTKTRDEGVMEHEERHFRNQFLLPLENKLTKAQNEIIAYTEQGSNFTDILNFLTQEYGSYDYYKEEIEAAETEEKKLEIQKEWLRHCRRLFKGLQAIQYRNRKTSTKDKTAELDEFTIRPMAQWRKLLDPEKAQELQHDFFLEASPEFPVDIIKKITDLLTDKKNAGYVEIAGLSYDKLQEFGALFEQAGFQIKFYDCRVQSGIAHIKIRDKDDRKKICNISLAPSMKAIEDFRL